MEGTIDVQKALRRPLRPAITGILRKAKTLYRETDGQRVEGWSERKSVTVKLSGVSDQGRQANLDFRLCSSSIRCSPRNMAHAMATAPSIGIILRANR